MLRCRVGSREGQGGVEEHGGRRCIGEAAMLALWGEIRNLASCALGANGLTVPCVCELVRSIWWGQQQPWLGEQGLKQ